MTELRFSRKYLALILVIALAIGLLAGCGGQTAGDSAPSASASAAESAEAVSAAAPADDGNQEAPADAEPADSSAEAEASAEAEPEPEAVLESVPVEFPISEEPITFDIFCNTPESVNQGLVQDMNEVANLQEICEASNVYLNFDCASFWTVTERFNLIIASNDLPDLMSVGISYPGGTLKAVEDDVFIQLDDLIPDYMPNYRRYLAEDDIYSRAVESDGSVVAIYFLFNAPKDAAFGHVVRQDWLDKLGLDVPVTYDDYTDTLKAFKDEYGCTSAYLLTSDCMSMGGTGLASGYGVIGFKVNGDPGNHFYRVGEEVHSSLLEDGYRDYVGMLHDWYANGLISPDFINTAFFFLDGNNLGTIGANQTGIFYAGQDYLNNYADLSEDPDFALTGLEAPISDYADMNRFNDNIQRWVNISNFITTACEAPEILCQFIDYWYSDPGMMEYSYGVEGLSYTLNADGEVEFTDLVMNDPDFSPATALYKYCFYQALFGVQDSNQARLFYTELSNQAVGAWSSNCDDSGLLPPISINDPEYSAKLTDVDTYASENVLSFITGVRPMEEWDDFVSTLKDMGIEDCLATMQEEYTAKAEMGKENPYKP